MMRQLAVFTALATLLASALFAQRPRSEQETRPRDTSAQTQHSRTGRITGRVLSADTGRPIRRARTVLSAAEVPEGRVLLTDDSGGFDFTELPAGRYTLNVSKTGYVSLSYGQRRPFQAGTPIQLTVGQELRGIVFNLPRGSVIAGHVMDETGEPTPGATVQVVRYQNAEGERQLVPAGNAQTDDQGAYRVWGLNPGEYYISAVARNLNLNAGGADYARGGRGPVGGRNDSSSNDQIQRAYAPTYFPGVASISDARPVSVGIGQEVLDVNFGLLLVHTARVAGMVTHSDGSPATNGQVNLTPDERNGRQLSQGYGGRLGGDGRFSFASVPPGSYTLRARANNNDTVQFAAQPVTVAGGDLANLQVIVYPGATVSGTVTFEGGQSPDLNQVRIVARSADNAANAPSANARIDKDGAFTLVGVPAGLHWIRVGGSLRGWSLKSVLVDNRDVVDTPIELRSSQKLNNVGIVFTNKQTEINGTVTGEQSAPITDFTVLAFPTDSSLWRTLSRHIATARPDQNGKFQIRGLPPGGYYVVTVDPSEPGEWFDPSFLNGARASAAHLTLTEGEVKTQDFRVSVK